jgi:hypothetical protein
MRHRCRPSLARLAWFVILACLTTSAAACNRSSETATAPAGSPAAEPAPAQPAVPTAQPAVPTAQPAAPTAQPAEGACAHISDWRSEIIEMPPEFAPTLPAGQEELRFAPGMFEPTAADYFTYAFVIRLAQPATMAADRAQIESLLDRYYQGLVAAVAADRKLAIPVERVDATVTGQAPVFQATVTMYDAFVTGAPLTLHMNVTMAGACLRAAASPQPRTHEVWHELAQATACLPCAP